MKNLLIVAVLALVFVTGAYSQGFPTHQGIVFEGSTAGLGGQTFYSPLIAVSGFDSIYIISQTVVGDSCSYTLSLENYAPNATTPFFSTPLDTVVRAGPQWAGQGIEIITKAVPRGTAGVRVKLLFGAQAAAGVRAANRAKVWYEVIDPR